MGLHLSDPLAVPQEKILPDTNDAMKCPQPHEFYSPVFMYYRTGQNQIQKDDEAP